MSSQDSPVRYFSMEMQDQFVHALCGDEPGTFLDLGSAHPYFGNNSVALENLGWKGVAFDNIDHLANEMNRSQRKTICYPIDVTQEQPFLKILEKHCPEKHFTYISLDVDEASIACLRMLLDNGYSFDVMTFEHDFYLEGDTRRGPAWELLEEAGYECMFSNVKTCPHNWSVTGGTCRPTCKHTEKWEWEDWWVGPRFFKYLPHGDISLDHQECVRRTIQAVKKEGPA